ncbi:MAG: FAD-dependent oxidoreductase [Acidimicrobiia bacterium]
METFDGVVIAGAGPVGCTAAALLNRRGIPVLLLEAEESLPEQLRASTFHPPTLEMYDEFGIIESMKADGLVAPSIQYRDRSEGVAAEFHLRTLEADTSFPYRIQVEQWRVCGYLLDQLSESPDFEVRFSAGVSGVVDREDGVVITLTDGTTLRAPWLIGADGAHSAVRKQLDIEFSGWTYEDNYLVVSTPYELTDHIPDLALINYVADPQEWLVLLRTKPLWRVLFPIHPPETDDEAMSDAAIQRRLHGVVPKPGDFEIGHRTMYSVHQRVAETFRSAHVLLAGDAAHINTPLGGMGLNNGVHDAWLLGELLGDVFLGRANADVLDAYSSIRRTVAIDHVQRTTHQNAVTLSSPDAAIRYKALDDLRMKSQTDEGQRTYLLQASMLNAFAQMRDELALLR